MHPSWFVNTAQTIGLQVRQKFKKKLDEHHTEQVGLGTGKHENWENTT